MIDLHLHTTASDGTLAPAALVERAAAAGLTVLSITDHDTVAGLDEARAAAHALGVRLVDGIEITAVEGTRDVHMLGYFFDPASPALAAFLERQRADRVRRVADMAARLDALGVPIDATDLLDTARREPWRSVGRPQIADALVAAGHVRGRDEAFGRWLGDDGPAYVARRGGTPEDVIVLVREAGGIVSLAHPGLLRMDDIIPRLAHAGLAAIEVCHSDHDVAAERHYRHMAASHGLAVSGGSDYHGECAHRTAALGAVLLSHADFARLEARRP